MWYNLCNNQSSPIHNLTDITLPAAVKITLSLGLKFNFNLKVNRKNVMNSFKSGVHKLSWKTFFTDKEESEKNEWTKILIKVKKAMNLEKLQCPIESVLFSENFVNRSTAYLIKSQIHNDNVHTYLLNELNSFLTTYEVKIIQSDKNAGLVICYVKDYENEILRQLNDLNTYIPSTMTQFNMDMDRFTDIARNNINTLFSEADKKKLKSLIPREYKPAKFYILPKVHKKYDNFPVGRPISSTIQVINRTFSMILDAILRPLCICIPNLIIDSTHLLFLLGNLNLDPNRKYFMLASDIQSMYQELPIDACKNSCIKFFLENKTKVNFPIPISVQQLKSLLNLSLDYSYLEYKKELFFQRRGIQMGNCASVSVANITAEIELRDLWKPEMIFIGRYIDDIFTILDVTDLQISVEDWIKTNYVHNFLKFTHETSDKAVNFLDIHISIDNHNVLNTSLYEKEVSRHEYLHFYSNHPRHMINSLPYSCGLRVIRTCSDLEDTKNKLSKMFNKFRRRQYPESLLLQVNNRLQSINRNELIKPTSNLHFSHISMHYPDILNLNLNNVKRKENTKDIYLVFPFFSSPALKQKINMLFLNEVKKCRSTYLKSIVLDLNINVAFTIPNQVGRLIAGIEKRKEQPK